MASEYGWAKREILEEVYLDEVFLLVKEINRRKLSEWQMQLAIVQNPYTKKPKELWDILKGQQRMEEKIEYDASGLERLKQQLKASDRIIVK